MWQVKVSSSVTVRHYYLTPDRASPYLRHQLGQSLLKDVRKDELSYRFLYGTKRIKTFFASGQVSLGNVSWEARFLLR